MDRCRDCGVDVSGRWAWFIDADGKAQDRPLCSGCLARAVRLATCKPRHFVAGEARFDRYSGCKRDDV